MPQSTDASGFNYQTIDIEKNKPLPKPKAGPPAGISSDYNFVGCFCYGPAPAQPRGNIVNVTGLWAGTWLVSACPTEVRPDGTPLIGEATFNLLSLLLDTEGRAAQIWFNLNWTYPLSYGLMFIMGYLPG